MLTLSTAWAGETFTFNLGAKPGTSTPSGFFTYQSSGKWNFNSKFTGGEYDGITFSNGLKMEGTTEIDFTTTEVSTVTIVQSTWSANTIKLDDEELAVADATEGTGCRIYTIKDVAAGAHAIKRGSGESGLFYVKVEYADAPKKVTFINDANWEKVFVWAWNDTENFTGGTWPGTEITPAADGTYSWETMGNPTMIIFNDGGSNQTADLEFKDGGQYNSKERIITLKNFSATFKTDGMREVWAYAWNGDEKVLGDWPGTKMEGGNGEFTIAIKAEEAPAYIIFHDNAGNQTADLAFEDGKIYEYMLNEYTATFTTDAGWETVNAYAWTTVGAGEEAQTTEFLGAWPGTQMTAADGTFSISFKAFFAPDNILFNKGDEGKTADLAFTNGKAYKWITATPIYALTEGATFAAGTTVDVKDAEEKVVATLTYGVEGGAEFGAATAATNEDYEGFKFMTPGNGENGTADGGTVYTIVPKYNGTITVGVRLNGGKSLFISEDGENLEAYNGITIKEAANTSYTFDVKGGSTYKIYCSGSKLGFFGFDYKYEATPEPVKNTYTAKFENNGNWAEVYAYAWTTTGEGDEAKTTEFLGAWPGTKIEATDEGYVVTIEAEAAPEKIIFSNGADLQTADLAFENGKTYKFEAQPETKTFTATFENGGNWEKVYAYAWTTVGEGDEAKTTNFLGDWPGTELTKNAETGLYELSFEATEAPAFIIFNGGEGAAQTADLAFENGKAYKFEAQPETKTFTATFENGGNWEKVYAYAWTTVGEGDEAKTTNFLGDWPGTELTKNAETGLYELSFEATEAPAFIIFNGGEGAAQTADLAFENGKAYKFEAPETIADGYYLAGNMNDWTPQEAYLLTRNEQAEGVEEYTITIDLTAEAQFKIVKVEGTTQTWYPDGTGNAYGENGEIRGAGSYAIYFRPNADGGEDWFNRIIFAENTTGINGIYAEKLNGATIYNLNGQRVKAAQKGLYIINGKKVVIK